MPPGPRDRPALRGKNKTSVSFSICFSHPDKLLISVMPSCATPTSIRISWPKQGDQKISAATPAGQARDKKTNTFAAHPGPRRPEIVLRRRSIYACLPHNAWAGSWFRKTHIYLYIYPDSIPPHGPTAQDHGPSILPPPPNDTPSNHAPVGTGHRRRKNCCGCICLPGTGSITIRPGRP